MTKNRAPLPQLFRIVLFKGMIRQWTIRTGARFSDCSWPFDLCAVTICLLMYPIAKVNVFATQTDHTDL